MDSNCKEPIKILDLFAGAGGLSLGFEMARDAQGNKIFELHRAVEIDPSACATLRTHHSAEKVIEGDLTKKKIHEQVVSECKGIVSVVMGGIPCQSFSLIGPRSGYGKKMEQFKKDKRDHLYKEFFSIVKEIKPNILVIENVQGILSKKDGRGSKIIDRIIADFESLNYSFKTETGQKFLLLNAADYGVPQQRERVILIGIKTTWKNTLIPDLKPTHFNPTTKSAELLSVAGLKPYVTMHEAIGDLPKLQPKITLTGIKQRHKLLAINKRRHQGKDRLPFKKEVFLKHLQSVSPQARDYFNFVRPNGYSYTEHHIARPQQITDIKLFDELMPGEKASDFIKRKPKTARKLIKYNMHSFKDKYRRQRGDAPSTTIFAHLEKDGNRFIHPKQARTITPREAARLQSFPDDYVFAGTYCKKFKQIGNAVPPLLAHSIALNVNKMIETNVD